MSAEESGRLAAVRPAEAGIVALDSPRPDLLVFEVRGRIERPDIEWMADRVSASFDHFDESDLLIVMRGFDGVAPGAILDLKALSTETRSLLKVRRYGVVGAPAWARVLIETARFVTPVDSRTFPEAELAEAWRWINRTDR